MTKGEVTGEVVTTRSLASTAANVFLSIFHVRVLTEDRERLLLRGNLATFCAFVLRCNGWLCLVLVCHHGKVFPCNGPVALRLVEGAMFGVRASGRNRSFGGRLMTMAGRWSHDSVVE